MVQKVVEEKKAKTEIELIAEKLLENTITLEEAVKSVKEELAKNAEKIEALENAKNDKTENADKK